MKKQIVYGEKIRTNNQTFAGIAELWQRVAKRSDKVPLYAVYHNYESDEKGDYDLLIGTTIPDILLSDITLGKNNYLTFAVDTKKEQGVYEKWCEIWATDLKRLYTTDYEYYDVNGEITIFIAVKD
ncbi:putative transcriptional regulator protein yobU [Brochothrix thermosphacta]|uniref:effector binding domain-containing protein n=1 Tax=Brochothrix thermosphacta TaxID=2756 RepID=UPI000D7A2232|nr:effector binding domain-containing protein [Brochothrix thermosphacta]SPP29909.1 putative transcriptional regulator protein yobU [Brochothrix thermosphacta]